MLSALDMFKIGIGPSSSHTLGPMKAALAFLEALHDKLPKVDAIKIDIYGSLSLTGKGHQTDQAIVLGLAGNYPESVNIEAIAPFMERLLKEKKLPLAQGARIIDFDFEKDVEFKTDRLPLHENGLTIAAFHDGKALLEKTYYSIGGGVILEPDNFGKKNGGDVAVPYPFDSAQRLLDHCKNMGLSLATLILKNEDSLRPRTETLNFLKNIWAIMSTCMGRGLDTEGLLPGPLKIVRRAPALRRLLNAIHSQGQNPLYAMDWVNMCALAVAEENAAGGRVVTAPTNGACGIIPAVFAYYDKFVHPIDDEAILRFFLSAGAIGLLYRMNASISGAEVGCQGEVGVATSMAAAGLAELLGASPLQVATAAEIGMEHNLGLTCDPVGGQVQVPCIERNAINAVKAINAARMALERLSTPAVSLDTVIEAMFKTGKDMSPKYRETAQGGLAAVRIVGCS